MNVSCPECQSVFRVDPARVPGPGIRARCSVCGGIIPITATRSWTDDFATPHDAASLTASPRGTTRPANAGGGFSDVAGMAPRVAAGGVSPSPSFGAGQGPSAGPSRPVTPTRVPPFSPGRRPTPASASPVAPPASFQVPSAQPPMMPAAPQTQQHAPAPAPRQVPPATAAGAQPGNPPARTPDVPIGAPMSRPSAPPSSPAPSQRPAAPSLHDGGASASMPPGRPTVDATPATKPINPFLANDPNQKAKRLARALVSDMVAYHPQKRDEGVRAGTLKQLFREEIKKSYEEYVEQIGKEFAESTSHFQDALNDVLAGGKKVF